MRWHALWCVWFINCYCFPVSLCGADEYVYEILDLTIFESSISYTWITFQSPWWGWSVYFDLDDGMLWNVWLDHFGSLWSVLFWDTFWLLIENRGLLWFIMGYFLASHWEPMDIVIYSSWSLRIVGYSDLSLMPSIAYRKLLWSIIWCFSIARGELIWYYDYLYDAFQSLI